VTHAEASISQGWERYRVNQSEGRDAVTGYGSQLFKRSAANNPIKRVDYEPNTGRSTCLEERQEAIYVLNELELAAFAAFLSGRKVKTEKNTILLEDGSDLLNALAEYFEIFVKWESVCRSRQAQKTSSCTYFAGDFDRCVEGT
jgi:hypothetical protein